MTEPEQRALVTLVLMAAGADGKHDPREHAEVARVAQSLTQGSPIDVSEVYRQVEGATMKLEQVTAGLSTPETKKLAYELCSGVCSADGVHDDAEKVFLAALSAALGFDEAARSAAAAFDASANALAVAPITAVSVSEPAAPKTGPLSDADLDPMILNYATLNGALELFPDTLSSMAILPLQMRMVYRIGQTYGVELDKATIKELLATAGIGLTSQYVEQVGVSLVGRLFGRGILGSAFRTLATQSVSSGFSFATTYALGRLATRYYAGGRNMSGLMLKETYDELLRDARGLQGQYFTAIQQKATTINMKEIMRQAVE